MKMAVFKGLIRGLAAASVLVIVGCSGKQGPAQSGGEQGAQGGKETGTVDAANVLNNNSLNTQDRAEQLAKSAEQLVSVQGFAYASDVADLALQLDPNNLRAKLVKAALAPVMAQKGILARIAPLVGRDPALRDEYNRLIGEIQTRAPNSTLKSFLLEGPADISTEADLQKYLDDLADGFGSLRQFAKNSKNETITVRVSDAFFDIMKKRYEDACTVVQTSPNVYQYDCPSVLNMLEVNLNRADFESVQQVAAGYELYVSLWNSYNASGAVQVAINNRRPGMRPTTPQVIDELLLNPVFGTIRPGNGFQKVRDMGVDAVTGYRWITSNQASLCPLRSPQPRNRIGFLFNWGVCLENSIEAAANVQKTEDALAGLPVQVTFRGRAGLQHSTRINPSAWMNTPIANLRVLTPLRINRCGELAEVADRTAGGLFPMRDVNAALLVSNSCF